MSEAEQGNYRMPIIYEKVWKPDRVKKSLPCTANKVTNAIIVTTERMRVTWQHLQTKYGFLLLLFKGLELSVELDPVDKSFTRTHDNISSFSSGSSSAWHEGVSAICEFFKEQKASKWQREL